MLELKNINRYNVNELTRYEIAKAAGLSWPTVDRYLGNAPRPVHPSLVHLALLLDGMGVNWREVRLGDLLDDRNWRSHETNARNK